MTARPITQDQSLFSVIRQFLRFSFCLLASSCLFSTAAMGQSIVTGLSSRPGSGVSISMEGYYDSLPPVGYVPILVTISNSTDDKHAWRVRFRSSTSFQVQSTLDYVWTAEVEARQKKSFEVLVPVASTGESGYSVPTLSVQVEGYGMEGRNGLYAVNQRFSHNHHTSFTGLSPMLELHSKAPAVAHLDTMSRQFAGSQIKPQWLSEDWRAYIGFGSIFFADADWQQVRAGDRAAILNWVAQGGRLVYFTENLDADSAQSAGLPTTVLGGTPYGFGNIELVEWDGKTVPPEVFVDLITHADMQNHAQDLTNDYSNGWSLSDVVPASKPNAVLLVFSVLAFATLVGPVNLVLFAGKRRRHRLFVTTPVISIVSSLVMIGLIVMEDGIGGTGARVATILLMPDEHQVIHIQEQISRTGVVLGNRFPLSRDIYIAQPVLERGVSASRQRLSRSAAMASGDWFASRSYQAQYLSEVRPSRARVDRVDSPQDDAPVLLSTFEEDLVDVYYVDEGGQYWYADRVDVGRRTPMQRSTRGAFRSDFWAKEVLGSGIRAGGNIRSISDRDGILFGIMENPDKHFIDTHSAIDWKQDRLLVVGPCGRAVGGGS